MLHPLFIRILFTCLALLFVMLISLSPASEEEIGKVAEYLALLLRSEKLKEANDEQLFILKSLFVKIF